MSDLSDKIEEISSEFFGKLEIVGEVSCEKKDDYYYLNLKSDDPASLIGYHGQTLDALQLILSLTITKKIGEYLKIVLDISDWRKKREDAVSDMAKKAAIKAKFSGQEQVFSNMKSYERRIIHMALSDNPEVTTVSEGEGEDRIIKIIPKNQKDVS